MTRMYWQCEKCHHRFYNDAAPGQTQFDPICPECGAIGVLYHAKQISESTLDDILRLCRPQRSTPKEETVDKEQGIHA